MAYFCVYLRFVCAAISNRLAVIRDGLTGNADVTCITTEVESMDWFIMVESTNFDLNISFEMIVRSTSEDVVVEEGLVMSSVLRSSSISQDLNSINSTLLIMSSFMPRADILLTCTARTFSQTRTARSSIPRGGIDPMSECMVYCSYT